MFCRFCGKEIQDGGSFCVNCGKEAGYQEAQEPQDSQSPADLPVQMAPASNYHLAWFKFIIYFQLFANAVVMVYNGVNNIFTLSYGSDADFVYASCPMLKIVDVTYGIVCLGFAVTAILIRQRLAHYKKNAPIQYLGYVGAGMAAGLIYTFAIVAAMGTVSSYAMEAAVSNVIGSVLGTLIGAAVFFPLNYIYFKKRRELFIN